MPYVPLLLVEAAIAALQGKHAVAVLVIPAMVHAGVKVADNPERGTPYGSEDELRVLNDYFRIRGADAERPYRAVWESDKKNYWRDERYPGRSLQRMRTDQVKAFRGFHQHKAGTKHLWALRENAGNELAEYIGEPVRLVDLAIWYGRHQDQPDLDALITWFLTAFPLDQDALLGTIYTTDVPGEYRQQPFVEGALTAAEEAQATGAIPPAEQIAVDLLGLATSIEETIMASGFFLPTGLVRRVISAWLRGEIVVLVGQPGTGKTRFAKLLNDGLKDTVPDLHSIWLSVRPDFDEAEFIGYERLDGSPHLRDFATQILQTEEPLAPHLVVLEEFNLASLENYLSAVLIATQDPLRRVTLPGGTPAHLPVDTFFLATCNSYVDEPETRVRLSAPAKRRSAIIQMPNVLAHRYEEQGEDVFVEHTMALIEQERRACMRREETGVPASFDAMRSSFLQSVTAPEHLSERVRAKIKALGKLLLDTPEGRQFFTLGILRDIALSVAYAGRDEQGELRAFGEALAEKVLPQLRGPKARAESLAAVTDGLPNAPELARVIDQLSTGPGDDILPIV